MERRTSKLNSTVSTVPSRVPVPAPSFEQSLSKNVPLNLETLPLREGAIPLIVMCDKGRVVSMNDAAVGLTGFRADECIGRGLELFHADGSVDYPTTDALLSGAVQQGMIQRDLAIVHRNGSRLPVKVCITTLRHQGVAPYGFVYAVLPRTDHVWSPVPGHAEDNSLEEGEFRRVILAFVSDGVITTNKDGMITYTNPAAEAMTGWQATEAVGRPLREVFCVTNENDRELAIAADPADAISADYSSTWEYLILVSKNGNQRDITQTCVPVRGAQGRSAGTVIVFRDITSVRQTEQQLLHQITHDPLTGLNNRYEFERRLGYLFENSQQSERHALLSIDLDEFKIINDTCGHDAGDELLRQLAQVLKDKVRETDTVARLGGDEFGVVLEGCSVSDAQRAAHQLLWAIDAFVFEWDSRKYKLTASIGIAAIVAGRSVAFSLSAADSACHFAKEQGRNRIHIYQENDRDLGRHLRQMGWVPRLQDAIASNRFLLYAQPIVPLTPSSEPDAKHYEILLRLNDEQGRIVLPGAFIPAAERYHQMAAIDRWVLHTTLSKRSTLLAGEDCTFSLNLSGQTLGQEDFLHYVLEEIDQSGVDPRKLCFEITETAAIGNLDLAVRLISVLRQRGCRFALDDFGVGISSLSYLKKLQVDYLKIDGSFVRGMARNPMDRALVTAIQQVGRVIGIKTIAESIEDAETMEILRDLGVDFGQGYFFQVPQPIEELQSGKSFALPVDQSFETL